MLDETYFVCDFHFGGIKSPGNSMQCTIHLCFPVETMHLRKTHKSVAYNESKEKKKFGVLTIDNNGSTIWSNEFRMLMPSNRSKYMTKLISYRPYYSSPN